jgi:SAM-dependent methyltransferase
MSKKKTHFSYLPWIRAPFLGNISVDMKLHQLFFKEGDKLVEHGQLQSIEEPGLADKFTILRMAKFSIDFPALQRSSAQSINLIAPTERDSNMRNHKLLGYLRGNEDRCAVCQVGSDGSTGILSAFSEGVKATLGHDGYVCYFTTTKPNASSGCAEAAPSIKEEDGKSGTKRGFEQLAAMNHYNENLQRDRSTRHLSYILHLRNLNNCVKSHLISYAVKCSKKKAVDVLDLGCGMGGDIQKWLRGSFEVTRYVGVDIAKASLEQFSAERLKNIPQREKVTHLICADLGTESLTSASDTLEVHTWKSDGTGGVKNNWEAKTSPLTEADKFDVASCQFAMHYMFQNQAKADHFFAEISRHLSVGGLFVATTIDSRVIVDLAAQAVACDGSGATDHGVKKYKTDGSSITNSAKNLHFKDVRGYTLLDIGFDEAHWNKLLLGQASFTALSSGVAGGDDDWAYGLQYTFQLKDTNDASAVNAPEWLVPLGAPLERLAARHCMRVKLCKNFHEIASQDFERGSNFTNIRQSLAKFGVFNYKQTISAAEWELAHLYVALVFEKI